MFQPTYFFLIHLFTFSQIGWITLDNASNNDTFLRHLKELLHERGITFDIISQRIQFVTFLFFWRIKLIDGIAASLTSLISLVKLCSPQSQTWTLQLTMPRIMFPVTPLLIPLQPCEHLFEW
jgi:hypothetical protein